MDELIRLLESWIPGAANGFEPTPATDIATLTSIVGELPGAYLSFLSTLGEDSGTFSICDMKVSFYAEGLSLMYLEADWLERRRYVMFGAERGDAGFCYFMDRYAPHGTDDCMVVRMPMQASTNPTGTELYISLREFLYFEAYRTVRMPMFQEQRSFGQARSNSESGPTSTAADVARLALAAGFQRSGPLERCAYFEREGAALLVFQNPVGPSFSFQIASTDGPSLDAISAVFDAAPGIVVDPYAV